MSIIDIFDGPDSIINPTSSYDDMKDKIEAEKEEEENDSCKEKSIFSFLKRLLE